MPLDRLWLLTLVKYLSLPPVDRTVNTRIPPAVSNHQHNAAEVCKPEDGKHWQNN